MVARNRAIALMGVGYTSQTLATLGFGGLSITVTVVTPKSSGGYAGPTAPSSPRPEMRPQDSELSRLRIIIKYKGRERYYDYTLYRPGVNFFVFAKKMATGIFEFAEDVIKIVATKLKIIEEKEEETTIDVKARLKDDD